MKYVPNPMDVKNIELDPQIKKVIEKLSENTHEIWASARIDSGWKFGKKRNNKRKTTPLLVPYVQLPESEKEYDRKVVTNIIKTLKVMGFEIKTSTSGRTDDGS